MVTKIKVLCCLIVCIGILVGMYVLQKHQSTQPLPYTETNIQETTADIDDKLAPGRIRATTIPPEIIEAAEYRVTVGVLPAFSTFMQAQEYRRLNYKFNLDKSLKASIGGVTKDGQFSGRYKLVYEYEPASVVSGRPYFVTLSVPSDDKSLQQYKTQGDAEDNVTACYDGAKLCEFKITRAQAINIIRELKIPELSSSKEVLQVGLGPSRKDYRAPWSWKMQFSRKEGSDCFGGYEVSVNVENGNPAIKRIGGGCS